MQFLGKLIVLFALVTLVTKTGALLHIQQLEVDWFWRMDRYGDIAGWNLRFGLLVFGISLIYLGRSRERTPEY